MPERVDQGGVRLAGGTDAEADGVGEDDAAGVGRSSGRWVGRSWLGPWARALSRGWWPRSAREEAKARPARRTIHLPASRPNVRVRVPTTSVPANPFAAVVRSALPPGPP